MANFNALVATIARAKRRMDDCGGKLFVAQRDLTQAENDYKQAVANLDDEVHKACMPEAHPARALPAGVELPPAPITLRAKPELTAKRAKANGPKSIYRSPDREEP